MHLYRHLHGKKKKKKKRQNSNYKNEKYLLLYTRYIANKFLIQNINTYAVAQKVEWAYAFDVHCNAFIPVYLILYVVQLFFLPLILKDNWISMFIGNFMYCVALIWYMFGVFLGFNGKNLSIYIKEYSLN